eukprot:CAMPEP_0113498866 /NCGR_PEP_ID=MMETSP0014_2-20120614/31423_1 /TAXON_ID=2857 /ORGANISM="Nitzschia sp." /LENGTH=264 /DNA_ID=CAMNT_0000392963 /DNA_START=120 /DNA_END=911 /DNA_ORIENTATION=- /assembly_acc=CAM_ASM_000159
MELQLESELTNTAPVIESTRDGDDDDDVHSLSSKLSLLGGIDMISSPFTYRKREKELQMKQRRMKQLMIGKERRQDSRENQTNNSTSTKSYVPDEDDFQLFDVTSLPSTTIIGPTTPMTFSAKKWYDGHCDEKEDSFTTAATAPTTIAMTCHSSSRPPLQPSTYHTLSPMSSSSSSSSPSHPSPSNDYGGSELLPQFDLKKYGNGGGRTELLFCRSTKKKDILTHMTIQIPTTSARKPSAGGIKKVKKKKEEEKKKRTSEVPKW